MSESLRREWLGLRARRFRASLSGTSSTHIRFGTGGFWVQDSRDKMAALQDHTYSFPDGPPDAGINGGFEQQRLSDGPFQERASVRGDAVRQRLVGVVSVLLKKPGIPLGEADGRLRP